MNPEHESHRHQSRVDDAIKAVLAEPFPDEFVERVKQRAQQLNAALPAVLPRGNDIDRARRANSRSAFRGVTVAAALLVAVTSTFLLLDRTAAQAFAQVIEKVKAANSVQFTMTTRIGGQPGLDSRMFLENNQMRVEHLDGMLILVGDFDAKRAMFLDKHRKLAQSTEIDARASDAFANPVEQLRRAKSGDAEPVGEEVLNGRRTRVFRLRDVKFLGMKGPSETLVWVDSETELPAQITVRDTDPKSKMEIQFEQFVWNRPLDADLFSLEMPAGFESGIVMAAPRVQPSPPAAKSLDSPNVGEDGILSRDRVAGHLAWSPDGSTITALMRDPESVPAMERRGNELRQWDVNTGKLRWSETVNGAGALASTVDGKMLACVVGEEMQLREMTSGKIVRTWDTNQHVLSLSFSPDGKTIAAGISKRKGWTNNYSGGVQFWDVERASLLRTIPADQATGFVQYSPDGKHVVSDSGDQGMRMWDAASGKLIRIIPGRLADFSPDGKTMALISSGYKMAAKVDLINSADGSLIRSLIGEKAGDVSWLLKVTFSPDRRLLAAADWDGTVTVWNTGTGERVESFTETSGVHTAMFSPDGTILASGSENNILRLRKLKEPTNP